MIGVLRIIERERLTGTAPDWCPEPEMGFRWCFDFGGSEPSGSTQIVQNSDPWEGQQPFLKSGFQRAENLFNQPAQFYPNSTVVPFSGQTEQALGLQEQRALSGSPLTGAAQGQIQSTIAGDYLNQGNPAFQGMVDRIQSAVRPAVDAQFSAGGRYGSPAHYGTGTAALANAIAPIAFQNYSQERGNQLAASQLAPQLAATDYADIAQLQQVGAARERQAGSQLQEQISRFNFQQQEPRQRLAEFMALVGGGKYGGSSTTTQPIFSNPLATGLGTAATLAGIGGALFGPGYAKGLL